MPYANAGRSLALLFCVLITACAAKPRCETVPAPKGLEHFYAALAELKSGKRTRPVTVLHLGDSHIARDQMTDVLRRRWDEAFGDAGRGLQPGVPYKYYAPQGYTIAMRGAWDVASSHARDASGPFGLQGYRISSQSADAEITLDIAEGDAIRSVDIDVMGGPASGAILVQFDQAKPVRLSTRADHAGFMHLSVPAADARHVHLAPAGDGPIALFGWALLTGKTGIRYDSYGISGVTMEITDNWDKDIVSTQMQALKPDLIILGYGTNEGFDDGLDLRVYQSKFEALLKRFHTLAPQASVAVLGAFDGARRVESGGNCGGEWMTPPKLHPLREVQRNAALALGDYFFHMSQVMGRPCGIDQWVRMTPPLAYADHVHLKAEGAEKAGKALWQALMGSYQKACPAGR